MALAKHALKVAAVAGPIVAKEGPRLAEKAFGAQQDRKRAHQMAWDRRGKVGQVTFLDGTRRWIVADADLTPVASIPTYKNGTPEDLAEGTAGVNLARCLGAPAQEVRQEKQRADAQRKGEKAERKAREKSQK